MLPLHETDRDQLKLQMIPDIEDKDEFDDLLNRLKNSVNPKIYYHAACKVDFNNKITLSKKTAVKSDWHHYREYHQQAFNEIIAIIEEQVIKKGHCELLTSLHEIYIDSWEKSIQFNANTR